MKTTRRIIGVVLLAGICLSGARAQYHTQGVDPFSTRWDQYKTERYRLIYPAENVSDARQVSLVIDTASGALHYGLSLQAKRLPIVLHTQNLHSNGLVSWAPKRAELVTTPQTETFAVPWLKQLSLHEYRHVVQMSNLDRGWFHWLSFLVGEQMTGAAAIFMPKWYFEGDAVFAETAMSSYGRALQPEFTLGYRAHLETDHCGKFSLDKWFCGSFKDYVPDYYHLGYQIVNEGYKQFGGQMWDEVYRFVARNPYMVFPRSIAFKKFYKTTGGDIFLGAMAELKEKWDTMPPVEENMRLLETLPCHSYTLYSYPLASSRSRIIAHKTDYVFPARLVEVDPATGDERLLAYTGNLSSRPVRIGGELFWTEYQPSTFWEQRNRSVVRRMPADGSRNPRTQRLEGNLFYVTPYREGQIAAVDYDPVEKYSVRFFDASFRLTGIVPLPKELTIHGMAWDEKTNTLALITLAEKGMSLTALDPGQGRLSPITNPSVVTINHLTAADGKLFFNSIRSGIDESHFYDLAGRKEYQISESKFGTVMPSYDPSTGTIMQASYRRSGYMLSVQPLSEMKGTEYTYSYLPENRVNPEMADLGLPNLDTMELFSAAEAREIPSKRYRKGLNLFNVHSWAPISYDPFEMADDRNLDFNIGATVISQNALSNTEAFLSYGYVNDQSLWRAKIRLLALAPKFEFNTEYGGGYRQVLGSMGGIPLPEGWAQKRYFSIEGRVYLPVGLSSGHMLRQLTPSVSLTHYNTAIYRFDEGKFDPGYQKTDVSLSYSQAVRLAYRDLAPRWGFGFLTQVAMAPFNDDFSSLWSFYGNIYLPGLAPNHSLQLRGLYQTQEERMYGLNSNILFPRGVAYNFAPERLKAFSGNYQFPAAYPDGGIDEYLYIKRICADIFGGYARYQTIGDDRWQRAYSYGVEFRMDFSPFRTVGSDYALKVAMYKASDKSGLSFNISFSAEF